MSDAPDGTAHGRSNPRRHPTQAASIRRRAAAAPSTGRFAPSCARSRRCSRRRCALPEAAASSRAPRKPAQRWRPSPFASRGFYGNTPAVHRTRPPGRAAALISLPSRSATPSGGEGAPRRTQGSSVPPNCPSRTPAASRSAGQCRPSAQASAADSQSCQAEPSAETHTASRMRSAAAQWAAAARGAPRKSSTSGKWRDGLARKWFPARYAVVSVTKQHPPPRPPNTSCPRSAKRFRFCPSWCERLSDAESQILPASPAKYFRSAGRHFPRPAGRSQNFRKVHSSFCRCPRGSFRASRGLPASLPASPMRADSPETPPSSSRRRNAPCRPPASL